MNADVEKAVERIDHRVDYFRPIMETDWHTIRQALRDQDTEIVGLRMDERQRLAEMVELSARAERSDALLRDIKRWDLNQVFDPKPDYLYALPYDLRARITAHFGGEQ